MNTNEHDSIQAAVFERIRSGKVKMKPKVFFVLKSLAVLAVAALVLVLSSLLASFIFFGLRITGHEALLGFGLQGILTFLLVFPWGLVLIDVGLLLFLEWLLRRFSFAYRRSLLYSFIAILAVVFGIGFLFDTETTFHDVRFEEARRGELPPPLRGVYEGAHPRAPERMGVYRGVVQTVGAYTFSMTHDDKDSDEDDGELVIIPPPRFPLSAVHSGDRVYVAGEAGPDGIRAYGIHVFDAE